MTIGERIKELRKKNDLTQEKLADYLNISYQSVSKWECGVTMPDLSMIAPLTKLLHVSADELLGLTDNAVDERKAYFDAEYEEFWKKDDHDADYLIALQAVREYPGDFRYLEWLANDEYYTAFDDAYLSGEALSEHFIGRLESSIKHGQMILDDCTDEKLRRNMIHLLALDNKYLNRDEEARRYAEMCPENDGPTRDDVLSICLRGDELKKHRQPIVAKAFKKFIIEVEHYCFEAWEYDSKFSTAELKAFLDAEEAMIRTFVPDENYQWFNFNMMRLFIEKAKIAVEEGEYEKAVRLLAEAKQYAVEDDRTDAKGKYQFTSLFLKDYEKEQKSGRPCPLDTVGYWRETVKQHFSILLRDREDYKALMED